MAHGSGQQQQPGSSMLSAFHFRVMGLHLVLTVVSVGRSAWQARSAVPVEESIFQVWYLAECIR